MSPSLLKLLRTIIFAVPSILYTSAWIFILTFSYAHFGMVLLGTIIYDHEGDGLSRHANFETAFRAFSALFRMATGDAWGAMLADALNNPHVARIETRPPDSAVAVFFIAYIAFVAWVLIAMFVAIVQDSYATSNYEEGISIKFEDIESFQRKWLEFDRENTSYMRTIDLGLLLYACMHAAAPECSATDERCLPPSSGTPASRRSWECSWKWARAPSTA
jgi:hypothetical protein